MSAARRVPLFVAVRWLAVGLACATGALCAQTLRDPTQPPPQAVAGSGEAPVPEKPSLDLVRGPDGQYRILHDGRFLRVGQRLGDARITRITETQVWLQADGETRKWTRYPAVTVRPATPPGPRPVPPSTPQTGRPSP